MTRAQQIAYDALFDFGRGLPPADLLRAVQDMATDAVESGAVPIELAREVSRQIDRAADRAERNERL